MTTLNYGYNDAPAYDTNMQVQTISEIYYDLGEIMALTFDRKISKRAIRKNLTVISDLNKGHDNMAVDISNLLEEVEDATSSKCFPAQLIYKLACVRKAYKFRAVFLRRLSDIRCN